MANNTIRVTAISEASESPDNIRTWVQNLLTSQLHIGLACYVQSSLK